MHSTSRVRTSSHLYIHLFAYPIHMANKYSVELHSNSQQQVRLQHFRQLILFYCIFPITMMIILFLSAGNYNCCCLSTRFRAKWWNYRCSNLNHTSDYIICHISCHIWRCIGWRETILRVRNSTSISVSRFTTASQMYGNRERWCDDVDEMHTEKQKQTIFLPTVVEFV